MADRERPPSASNTRQSKGKDKDREPSIVERLQASGQLAISSVTAPQPLPGVANTEKTTGSFASSSGQGGSALDEAALHQNQILATGESFKHEIARSGEASRAFEQFQESFKGQNPGEHTSFLQSQLLPQSLARQESLDGHAVLDLLNGPDEDEGPMDSADEYGLSPAAAAKLRAALFGPGTGTATLSNLLDFTPNFIQCPGGEAGPELRQQLGTTNPAVARQVWAQQWSDVLSSYTDEVWGSLGPLVSDAKQEMEQLAEIPAEMGQESSETAAVDRLRQILAHVRGYT